MYSVPSAFGGEDFFGDNGYVGSSVDSVFGGQDFYGANGTRGASFDAIFGGGQDFIFDDDPFSE